VLFRAALALALLCLGTARGAAPSYSAAGIVNGTNFTPGPFAPNSILALFGSNLATSTYGITAADIQDNGGSLPTQLAGTQVFVGASAGSGGPAQAAPLYYVSANGPQGYGQVNFILPANLCPTLPCSVAVRLTSNSNSGPVVTIDMAAAAPALFPLPNYPGFVIATHGDSASLITPDSPAHVGDIAVLYVTGLGKTVVDPAPGELPNYTSLLADLADLKITLGGVTIVPATTCPSQNGPPAPCIQYAGLTPLEAALYQINLTLPAGIGTNPVIQVWLGVQPSPAGVQLAVQ
jgi:uncharacterized protein (TIGR03437 family)